MVQDKYDWMHCEHCDKLMPFKRWEGHFLTVWSCLGCSNPQAEKREDVA